jgi:pilus assembly protein CpaB
MTGFAVVFGLLAVFIAQVWLNNQVNMRAKHMQMKEKSVGTRTIVVAARPLRFGMELKPALLKEMPWPAGATPAGAFHKIADILSGSRRVVLSAIEVDEPVLALKITGPGQRATLSALVGKGMKAVTIRVNDVKGVGGFVLPGDHVDVILTRQIDRRSATTELVLQDARVLATDQTADDRDVKAKVAKSVTLEVTTAQAQKVRLAASVGSLSLLLRRAGETTDTRSRKITLNDLGSDEQDANDKISTTTVTVIRPKSKQDYTVPVEKNGNGALAEAELRRVAR